MNVEDLRSEPFLWIHLLGIAVFPIFVGITIVGLSIGDSNYFVLELLFLIAVGVLPIFLMQLKRPFDIFSILFLSLKPEYLSDRQKIILSLFKRLRQKVLSAITAVFMTIFIWLLYRVSPLGIGVADFLPQQRILGLEIAGIGFLAANLFLQIPLGVLLVLSTQPAKLTQINPYSGNKIQQDFTIVGMKSTQILWFVESEAKS
ncbi:MAG: low-complexity tail membrane protein [Pleurocapsa sp.]